MLRRQRRVVTAGQKILIAYGVLSIGFGFALGIPLARARMASPTASRHLVTAHLSAIIQGAVHISLAVAIGLSDLPAWLETFAAILLVTGSALFLAGATLNWLQRIDDHFAVRSLGWRLFATSSIGHLAGITLIGAGVATGL